MPSEVGGDHGQNMTTFDSKTSKVVIVTMKHVPFQSDCGAFENKVCHIKSLNVCIC